MCSSVILQMLAAVVLVGCSLSGCAQGGASEATRLQKQPFAEESLLLLPGATKVKRGAEYDGLLVYELDDPFPGVQSFTELERRLTDAGWHVLAEDLFNPGGKTALREWSVVEINRQTQFSWLGYWEDKDHNVIMVGCKYVAARRNREVIPGGPMEIVFRRFSQATADSVRKSVKR